MNISEAEDATFCLSLLLYFLHGGHLQLRPTLPTYPNTYRLWRCLEDTPSRHLNLKRKEVWPSGCVLGVAAVAWTWASKLLFSGSPPHLKGYIGYMTKLLVSSTRFGGACRSYPKQLFISITLLNTLANLTCKPWSEELPGVVFKYPLFSPLLAVYWRYSSRNHVPKNHLKSNLNGVISWVLCVFRKPWHFCSLWLSGYRLTRTVYKGKRVPKWEPGGWNLDLQEFVCLTLWRVSAGFLSLWNLAFLGLGAGCSKFETHPKSSWLLRIFSKYIYLYLYIYIYINIVIQYAISVCTAYMYIPMCSNIFHEAVRKIKNCW